MTLPEYNFQSIEGPIKSSLLLRLSRRLKSRWLWSKVIKLDRVSIVLELKLSSAICKQFLNLWCKPLFNNEVRTFNILDHNLGCVNPERWTLGKLSLTFPTFLYWCPKEKMINEVHRGPRGVVAKRKNLPGNTVIEDWSKCSSYYNKKIKMFNEHCSSY